MASEQMFETISDATSQTPTLYMYFNVHFLMSTSISHELRISQIRLTYD